MERFLHAVLEDHFGVDLVVTRVHKLPRHMILEWSMLGTHRWAPAVIGCVDSNVHLFNHVAVALSEKDDLHIPVVVHLAGTNTDIHVRAGITDWQSMVVAGVEAVGAGTLTHVPVVVVPELSVVLVRVTISNDITTRSIRNSSNVLVVVVVVVVGIAKLGLDDGDQAEEKSDGGHDG